MRAMAFYPVTLTSAYSFVNKLISQIGKTVLKTQVLEWKFRLFARILQCEILKSFVKEIRPTFHLLSLFCDYFLLRNIMK